ncbi:MAG: hypothetical protein A3B75_00665 [Candidatus Terrybacteria bacterium RIFCSPHIGHO2_02_FULL_43_14]|nr:MAG: hypothetical protein A3B75_00665 [Candidatus Terrybacteria bacterium RIFCSPHIGHO2_02_FULL_43_14]
MPLRVADVCVIDVAGVVVTIGAASAMHAPAEQIWFAAQVWLVQVSEQVLWGEPPVALQVAITLVLSALQEYEVVQVLSVTTLIEPVPHVLEPLLQYLSVTLCTTFVADCVPEQYDDPVTLLQVATEEHELKQDALEHPRLQ